MSDIEKQIREKRSMLDTAGPKKGHEDRFLAKLEAEFDSGTGKARKSPATIRLSAFRQGLQIAASIAIIAVSALFLNRYLRDERSSGSPGLSESFIEADYYYTSQAESKYREIESFEFRDKEEKKVLLEELKGLEAYHSELIKELELHPDDEQVVAALIRHYQLKMEVMDQIIKQLKQVESEITERYETSSI